MGSVADSAATGKDRIGGLETSTHGKNCCFLPCYPDLQKAEGPPMQTMNISLPDQLKDFVDHQVGTGRYSTVSEYVRDLIREDEKRAAREKLEALLVEGIESSGPTEMTRDDWDGIRREALKQFESRKTRKA
jgi:antitoxin ParD1/3/4